MNKYILTILIILAMSDLIWANSQANLVRQEIARAVQDLSGKVPIEKKIAVDNLIGDTPDNDITDYLVTELTIKGYTPLDRRNLDEILKQQGIELNDYFDFNTVKEIGQIEGVDAILYGTVKEYYNKKGKIKFSGHLQCSYLEKGVTPWAHDLYAELTTTSRKTLPYLFGGCTLIFFLLVYFGLKHSGQSKSLTKH